jgi:hypothetical protein
MKIAWEQSYFELAMKDEGAVTIGQISCRD